MKSERDDWDQHWDNFAEAASLNPAQRMRHELAIRLLRDSGGAGRLRILDLGSGQGDFAVQLRRAMPEAELLGFEMSHSGVAISQKKVPAATFLVVDLFAPPPEAGKYAGWANAAVCSEVLEHVDSPVDFLKAARRYLADGARLVVTVPGGPMSAFDKHIGHRQHFTPGSLSRVLTEAGFAVERTCRSGFPFFNLYRCVVIARGGQLVADVAAGHAGASGWLARVVMAFFRGLFRFNLTNSPFGWQVVAVARAVCFQARPS
ncbi:MAG TPA: class I SAM-dependent methyltransferase [Lacunisphaera sp.]|nr:class I SAM-dependent methyltransferase [Lacunisphaera sp.]